jgi:hypothetical protein
MFGLLDMLEDVGETGDVGKKLLDCRDIAKA